MKDSSWRIGKAPGGRILYNMANGMLRPASEILRGRNPLLPSAVSKHLLQMFDEGVSCLLPGCHIIHQPTSKRATEPGKGFKTLKI